MDKGIILFQSKYGATKKYAKWLKEFTHFDCMKTKEADIKLIKKYDIIILGGGIYASGIAGLSFLKKHINILKDKKIVVFCVGASPYDKDAFLEIYHHNFKHELANIPCFYCRGIWNEDIMTFKDKTLCKMLQKTIAKKDPSTYESWEKGLMSAIGQKCDWTDKTYLEPILQCISTI